MERFQSECKRLKQEITTLEKKYSGYGLIRFIVFVLAVVTLIVGFYDSRIPFIILGAAATVLFIILVFFHGRLSEKLEYTKAKEAVNDRYVKRFDDSWKGFEETGREYLSKEDLVSKDMDLLGDSSLFQFMCVAGTEGGKTKLADTLKNPDFTSEELKDRQEAIKELSEKIDFSMDFEALCYKSSQGKKSKGGFLDFLAYCSSDYSIPIIFNILRFLFPIITIALLVLGFLGVVNLGFGVVSFFVVLLFSWLTSGISGQAILPMVSFGYALDDYIGMFELIAKEDFSSKKLQDINKNISNDNGALLAIKKLKTISAAFNIRYNPIVHQVLCGFLMWDFHLGFMMDRWKKENGGQVKDWIDCVSQVEELLCFAAISRTREVTYGEVTRHNHVNVVAHQMRHPLINPSQVVANDVDFSGGTTIITGSNMSGKTTFLRTLGINLVLAFAGGPVLATDMKADYMTIFTSMRVTDDVSNGISTFYAEILRIKTMVEYKKSGKPMLCLIDEIFKGTNSADRIVGATQVIKKLSDDYSMTIVSTHDFELCDIKDHREKPASNYHFSEYYEDNQLKFDYQKKDGRCTTTNAMYILKMAGLT